MCNATFLPKLVEGAVAKQLYKTNNRGPRTDPCGTTEVVGDLTANELLPRHQSAYRKQHSTETGMLRVLSDVLNVADDQRVTLI